MHKKLSGKVLTHHDIETKLADDSIYKEKNKNLLNDLINDLNYVKQEINMIEEKWFELNK